VLYIDGKREKKERASREKKPKVLVSRGGADGRKSSRDDFLDARGRKECTKTTGEEEKKRGVRLRPRLEGGTFSDKEGVTSISFLSLGKKSNKERGRRRRASRHRELEEGEEKEAVVRAEKKKKRMRR